MADEGAGGEKLRDRITRQGEDALGKLAQDLLENPLVTGAISRAFEARERAVSAQETAMSALNLPSAADLERLTRRLRSVSQRLEGIEDGVDRLDRRFEEVSRTAGPPDERLAAIESQLAKLAAEVAHLAGALDSAPTPMPREQERLEVDKPAAKPPARKRGSAKPKGTKAQEVLGAAERRRSGGAERGLERLERVVAQPLAARACDPEHGGRRRPAAPGCREHRRRRQVARERAGPRPGARQHRVVDVGRRHEASFRSRRRQGQSVRERPVGLDALAGAERAAGAVRGQRGVGHDQRAQRRGAEARRGADAHEPARAERDQLGHHGSRAGAAQPGALDRQERAVGRDAAVAPQPAVVVEHPRPVDQLRRQPQGAAGVAGQQDALGDRLVRLEDHGCVRHVVAHSS